MMGNHIIKAARCALLPASRHIKQQQVMGSKKERKEAEEKKKSSLRNSSLKQIESSPLGLG